MAVSPRQKTEYGGKPENLRDVRQYVPAVGIAFAAVQQEPEKGRHIGMLLDGAATLCFETVQQEIVPVG